MAELLHIIATVDADLGLALELDVDRGSAVIQLKEDLAKLDLTGKTKVEDISIHLVPPGHGHDSRPLQDDLRLTEQDLHLYVCQHPGMGSSEPCRDAACQPDGPAENGRIEAVNLCVPADGGMEEIHSIELRNCSSSLNTIAALQRWIGTEYKLVYHERLQLCELTAAGKVEALRADGPVPLPPANIIVRGPAAVVRMLGMSLRRCGEPTMCRQARVQPSRAPEPPPPMLPLAVTTEAFDSNLAAARSARVQDGRPLRIVFLDVDGVLNCGSSMEGVVERLARRLVWLVHEADACCVLSTTWRCSELGKVELLTALSAVGVPASRIVGQTPEVPHFDMCAERAGEICAWVDSQPEGDMDSWVVLDDMSLEGYEGMQGHFVRTNPIHGLSDANSREALQILVGGRHGAGG